MTPDRIFLTQRKRNIDFLRTNQLIIEYSRPLQLTSEL
jgi:hypothetical protein